ncbi:SGNH/GDSL hydrolase family protein [Terribacillus sp. 179-K 1B1 HS]|uniref:SGNH/GDSL hydrolase family protein n=1 Tax=Terribacillus sp. 179-K 1B1 HS TaxID=3142388 RepID=UPI00399EF123
MATADENVRNGIGVVGYDFREMRNVINANTTFTYQLAKQTKQIIADAGDNNAEIVAARTSITGRTFQTLGDRADAQEFKLEEKLNKGSVAVSDIDKNKGKFDQTYFTDETIKQWTGTAPVNAIPADKSITTEKYADKSLGINALSNDINAFEGIGVSVTRTSDFENAWGLKVVLNTSEIDVTNKNISYNFEFLSGSTNADQFWTKIYVTDNATAFGLQDYSSDKINVSQNIIYRYNAEYSSLKDGNYVVIFLWMSEKEKIKADYYFRNLLFKVDGNIYVPDSYSIYNGVGDIENVSHTPSQIPNYKSLAENVTSGIQEFIESKQIKFDNGFYYKSKINSQNNLIQPALVFDATGISYAVGAKMVFSADVISLSNAKLIDEIRYFINANTTTADDTSGAQQSYQSSVNFPISASEITTYKQEITINTVQNGIHVYPGIAVNDVDDFAEFEFFNVSLTIDGKDVPLVSTTDIYRKAADGTFEVYSDAQPDSNIATVGYVRKTVSETIEEKLPYVPNVDNLYGKTFVLLGDSNGAGHTLDSSQTWAYKLARRNSMTLKNYSKNGICLGGNGNSYGDSMVNSYVNMDNDADYVAIFGGTNDQGRVTTQVPIGESTDQTKDTFKGSLNILCNGLISKYPKANIFFITPYHLVGKSSDYADAIIEICSNYSIPVFDNYRKGGVYWGNSAQTAALTLGDGIHLNEDGQEYVMPKYESFMRQL